MWHTNKWLKLTWSTAKTRDTYGMLATLAAVSMMIIRCETHCHNRQASGRRTDRVNQPNNSNPPVVILMRSCTRFADVIIRGANQIIISPPLISQEYYSEGFDKQDMCDMAYSWALGLGINQIVAQWDGIDTSGSSMLVYFY